MPKVSVIMSAHNYAEFVGSAIKSVLNQTYKDFELIIIDDASTDDTVKVIKNFTDSRIKLFEFKTNKGESAAENYGILHSKGKYIAILNADDEYYPEKLEKQVEYLDKHPNIGAVFTKVQVIDDKDKHLTDKNHPYYDIFEQSNRSRYEWLRRFFFDGNCLCHPSVMIRRLVYNTVGMYDERFVQIQDLHLWVRLCMKFNIYILPEKLTKFRVGHSDKQISGNTPEKLSRYFYETEKLLENYLQIKDIGELLNIFPEIASMTDAPRKEFIPYYIAQLLSVRQSPPQQRLAADIFFNLFKTKRTRNKINYIHNFAYPEFIKHTGRVKTEFSGSEFKVINLTKQLEKVQKHNSNLENTLLQITSARTFRLWQYYNKLKINNVIKFGGRVAVKMIRKILSKTLLIKTNHSNISLFNQYQLWVKLFFPKKGELLRQVGEIKKFKYKPKISLVIPNFNTPERFLKECIESVMNQSYHNWEICIADDGSENASSVNVIKAASKKDKRIKYLLGKKNKGIVATSNKCLGLATGEFIGLLDSDDILWPNALYEVAKLLNLNRKIDFIYTDEDKLEEDGKTHVDPFFKPDWSPDYLRCIDYITHFTVVRKSLIDKVGKFKKKYEGAQDWDLTLRTTLQIEKENSDKVYKRISHIPKVLYSWRKSPTSTASEQHIGTAKPYVFGNQQKVLMDDLKRRGLDGKVETFKCLGVWKIQYKLKNKPLISIIIPTKGKYKYLSKCLRSILAKSTYNNYELIIINNGSDNRTLQRLFSEIAEKKKTTILRWSEKFNFSSVCNLGAKRSDGEYLLFLNDDTEVIAKDWLESLLEYSQQKDVGITGAKLVYPDDRIQHMGIALGMRKIASHPGIFKNDKELEGFPFLHAKDCVRNVSAVTAACMLIRKDLFMKSRGFDERFSIAYNDVEFCYRINKKFKLKILYIPYAKLLHHESISVGRLEQRSIRSKAVYQKELNLLRNVIDVSSEKYLNRNITFKDESLNLNI